MLDRVDGVGSFEGTLYFAVRQRILSNMRSGEWGPGTRIPAEAQLAGQMGVSIGTLRKAVDALVAERLLLRRPGRGTFVAGTSREEFFNSIFNFVDRNGQRVIPDVRLLSARMGAPDREGRRHLRLERGDRVVWVENLRLIDGSPVILDRIQIPFKLFPTITPAAFVEGIKLSRSVFEILAEHEPYSIVRVEETLSAAPCEAPIAEALQVPPDAPVLRIERVAFSFDDLPVELRYRFVSSNKVTYRNVTGIKA